MHVKKSNLSFKEKPVDMKSAGVPTRVNTLKCLKFDALTDR